MYARTTYLSVCVEFFYVCSCFSSFSTEESYAVFTMQCNVCAHRVLPFVDVRRRCNGTAPNAPGTCHRQFVAQHFALRSMKGSEEFSARYRCRVSLSRGEARGRCSVLQCVVQCVAVCCSVLQCVAVCCSVLQCVEVCCSVLRTCAHINSSTSRRLVSVVCVRVCVCV